MTQNEFNRNLKRDHWCFLLFLFGFFVCFFNKDNFPIESVSETSRNMGIQYIQNMFILNKCIKYGMS